MNESKDPGIIPAARELLSGGFRGVLATHSIECKGYPIGSLLPFSIGRDGWPLMLVSHLARHTRNLGVDPCCSLTITEAGQGDSQRLTRLSCLADAIHIDQIDPRAAERHFRYFPESRVYYEELSFHFLRLRPVRFYCVAGFGAARWIGRDRMEAGNPFTYSEESDLLQQLNESFKDHLVKALHRSTQTAVRPDSNVLAVGIDPLGTDLKQEDKLFRIPFFRRLASLNELLMHPEIWL